MAKLNTRPAKIYTHEGAIASHINPEQQLRRSVMSCLLWEREFYEDGITIADRIASLIPLVPAGKVADIAIEAREQMKLRHVPLFIVREMAKLDSHKHLVADTLGRVIQRADELTEFLCIYWKEQRQPVSAQVKKGLASAFLKFNEHQFAKYNRGTSVKLKDVLRICHAKPSTKKQSDVWKRIVSGELSIPDTWEVALSSGKNKTETWERLIAEKKLGGLAFLRNLRNMKEAGVAEKIIFDGLSAMSTERILPFRFISAAKHVPHWESEIEKIMFKCLEGKPKFRGKTILVVDVSGSMYRAPISSKSELTRIEAACALAVLARESCDTVSIYATAGNDLTRIHATQLVAPRRGFALKDAVYGLCSPLGGGGIFLKQVLDYVYAQEKEAERIIVITDEQDCSYGSDDSPAKANAFGRRNYLINVASAKNGIGYGKWVHIDGFSETVLDYIQIFEGENK